MTEIVQGFPSTFTHGYQLNVINILRQAVRSYGRQEIVACHPAGRTRTTYAATYARVQRLANALQGLGAAVGDRIGVLDWNSLRHFETYYGIPGYGAVLLLLNIRLAPPDLGYVINHAGARLVFVDETLLPIAEAVAPACPGVQGWVILTDRGLADITTKLHPVYSYEELLAAAAPVYRWPVMDENSACSACYTTGTTGRPKGVYYSHRSTYLHAMAIAQAGELTMRECYYQLVPMFHAMGWGTPYAAVAAGAKFVLPGMYNIFDLGSLAEPLVSEKVTVTAGAPALLMPMLEYIRKLERKPDLSGARFLCGASEPSLALMQGFMELTGAEVIHAYGATETSPLVSGNRLLPWLAQELSPAAQWDLKRKQGLPVVGLDVKVVDPLGRRLPHDGQSAGEILIRGPWITGAYHDAPGAETGFTEDGYWRSGDAGTIDAHGYIKVTDRVKDVIKSGGEWISSVDMENAIMSHPAVLEAAVAGVPHPKWEERPVALVVLRPEHAGQVDQRAIVEHLSATFAKWQLPDAVIFVEAIPKTSVGKFNKKAIRQEYRELYTAPA